MSSDPAPVQPTEFVVRHQAPTGGRWVTVAVVPTRAEAVAAIDRAGNWHFTERPRPRSRQPSLPLMGDD